MKRLLLLLLSVTCLTAYSQSRTDMQSYIQHQKRSFKQYREQAQSEYSAFLKERNAEFASFMSQDWKRYNIKDGQEVPKKPIPQEPIIAPQEEPNTTPVKVPIKHIVKIPKVKPTAPQFKPTLNSKPPRKIPTIIRTNNNYIFEFAGTKISVGLKANYRFTLKGIMEKNISDTWLYLSESDINKVVVECLKWKETLALNDYLYVLMIDDMCSSFFGSKQANEATLLKTFLLAQSGYDTKCARTSTKLVMLLAVEEPIYKKNYLTINGTKYYIIDTDNDSNGGFYTFSQKFSDKSKSCSMRIENKLVINRNMMISKEFKSSRYPSLSFDVSIDKNLLELYNKYPQCKWDVYAQAPMSSELSAILLPKFKALIKGKTEKEAVNMILNFVQTAFKYKTDSDYFGYERSLFVDETFHYSYSDCEDRSILFSNLVKNLLGLDVVLLYFPNHMATAVNFTHDINGDFLMVNGNKYVICDPTYIGANAGATMPIYRGASAEVIIL